MPNKFFFARRKHCWMSKPSAGASSGPYFLVSINIKLYSGSMYIDIHIHISGLPYCSNIVYSHCQCGRHIIEWGGDPLSLLLYTLRWIIHCTDLNIRGHSHITFTTKGMGRVVSKFQTSGNGGWGHSGPIFWGIPKLGLLLRARICKS